MDSHKVQFSTTDAIGRHGEGRDIAFAQSLHNVLQVNIGYIQSYHQYKVTFLIPKTEVGRYTEERQLIHPPGNEEPLLPSCKFLSSHFTSEEESLQVTAEIFANEGRHFREELLVDLPNTDKVIKVSIVASVLGKYEGTPRLSLGVKCVGHIMEDEQQ